MESLAAQFSFVCLHPVLPNVTEWNSGELRRKLYEGERDRKTGEDIKPGTEL
jgi:hypothetical protein